MVCPLTLKIMLFISKIITEIVYMPICVFRYFQKSKKCPPINDNILLLSAAELTQRIRTRQITCVKAVKAYINRINEVNPIINAVIENRFQEALKDARKVDEFLQHTKLNEEQIKEKYPLLGVPITVKGSIAVEGMLHSSGSLKHNNVKANSDATVVKNVKDAGAIPLLISNVPEMCFSWECGNNLIGTTSNPYDTARTPGGSSGGEASLVGCGASAVGLASDLAGSIRVPAHYCGVWGHKPSPRVVACSGHYPTSKNAQELEKLFTIGPITKYASDLKLVLNVIAEPSAREKLKLNQRVELKKVKVYYMKNIHSAVSNGLTEDSIKAIDKVVTYFNTLCESKCTEVQTPLIKNSAELSFMRIALLNMDIDNFFDGKDGKVYWELFKLLVGKTDYTLGAIGYGILKHMTYHFFPEDNVDTLLTYFNEIREKFLEILDDNTVLITAVSPSEAVYHNDGYRYTFDYGYTPLFNILGFPATSCPVGFSAKGLPIGIQVVAAPNLDRILLSVAEELEKVFGGWQFH